METFKCPKCGFEFEDCESYSKYVTYWGEEGWEECDCPECEHKFLVKEDVIRTWEVKEIIEEVSDGS